MFLAASVTRFGLGLLMLVVLFDVAWRFFGRRRHEKQLRALKRRMRKQRSKEFHRVRETESSREELLYEVDEESRERQTGEKLYN